MATMVDRMLDFADESITDHPRSSAAKRRAVSTAYYAVFHEVMATCTEQLLPYEDIGSVAYERVYRAIDHGPLRKAFQTKDSPLQKSTPLREIGELLGPLQSARMLADYAPPRSNLFGLQEAHGLVDQAREIVDRLKALNDEDKRSLAVHLLFKDRPKD